MRDLFLTGFMGTGKTSAARVLASRYGLDFVDTDSEIVRRTGRSIAELFAREGEESFRALETEVLRGLGNGGGRVIATGGGTLLSATNRQLLPEGAHVICLTCEPETIERRLAGTQDRPLLIGPADTKLRELLHERAPFYAAFPQIDTTGRSVDEVADAIASSVNAEGLGSLRIGETRTSTMLFRRGVTAHVGEIFRFHDLHGDALVVTDERVASLGPAEQVVRSLQEAGYTCTSHTIPSGEQYKSLDTVQKLYGTCHDLGLDRSAIVVGVGGGVVGDIAGLLAATYLRGLRLALLPTTLLAQVDASIGGKVGVDFAGTKNMVGAFHPATLVLVDPDTLRTLPASHLSDGLAEIVKIGMIDSSSLLGALDGTTPETLLDHPEVIRAAAEHKLDIVQRDPFERGERMLLNFGHTVGHGIEAASGYRLSHGRAVSIGMAAETRLAVDKGCCRPDVLDTLLTLLDCCRLPVTAPALAPQTVLRHMSQDKKRQGGSMRIAVPFEPGRGGVIEISPAEARAAVSSVTEGTA